MSDRKEKLSALLDNALEVDELDQIIHELEKRSDSELDSGQSSRYQMMGEAMRSQVSDVTLIDISAQVREAIDSESMEVVHEYPKATAASNISDRPKGMPWFDLNAWLKPLGGLAVAASVAMITVFMVSHEDTGITGGVQQVASDNTVVDLPKTSLVSAVPVLIPSAQEVLEQNSLNPVASVDGKPVNLDAYLAEHAEFAAQDTMQGRMPYVRAVSYRSE